MLRNVQTKNYPELKSSMAKHAYLIMAHDQFNQLKKLILLLDDPRNNIYVHVDAKSVTFNQDQFSDVAHEAKLTFVDRKNVTWGAFSQIRCELELLEVATKEYHDYYHLLSGVDLPIKSQDEIYEFFDANHGTEFLYFHEGAMEIKSFRNRIKVYHFFQEQVGNKKWYSPYFIIEKVLLKLQELIHIDRLKNSGLEYQKGTNWFSITHEFARYAVSEAPMILETYKFTKCADEIFLHTLAWNSRFKASIHSDSKRLIDWIRGTAYTFRLEDFEVLMDSSCFWARKFNENIDPTIVSKVFEYLVKKSKNIE